MSGLGESAREKVKEGIDRAVREKVKKELRRRRRRMVRKLVTLCLVAACGFLLYLNSDKIKEFLGEKLDQLSKIKL